MKTIDLTFPVSISPCGDMSVEYPVTSAEYKKLKKAIEDEEYDFCDNESLSSLYEKIVDSAYDDMANGIFENKDVIQEYMGGVYSFDKALEYVKSRFDICIDYPEIEKIGE